MNHRDHVELIRPGVGGAGGTWADLGSGTGAFTLALADLLGPGAAIVSVDRDAAALREQAVAMAARFPGVKLDRQIADFRDPLALPTLDGIVMANALHFVARREQVPLLRRLSEHLRDPLALPTLDGIVMANALHFVARREQVPLLRRLSEHLRPGGRFLVVEYDAEKGNPWVPHPFGPATWARMAAEAGLTGAREIGRVPSRWLGAIWSGISERPSPQAGA